MMLLDQLWRLFCRHPSVVSVYQRIDWNFELYPNVTCKGTIYSTCLLCGARLRKRVTQASLPPAMVKEATEQWMKSRPST